MFTASIRLSKSDAQLAKASAIRPHIAVNTRDARSDCASVASGFQSLR
jgi:hypothetical protein